MNIKCLIVLLVFAFSTPVLAGWFDRPALRDIVIVNKGKQYTVKDDDYFSCIAGTPIHKLNDDDARSGHSCVVLNGYCYIKGVK